MQVGALAKINSIIALPLLDTRGHPLQGGSSRFSPPAGETAGRLGAASVGKEARIHLGLVFSNRSKAKTAGGNFIAHCSQYLFG